MTIEELLSEYPERWVSVRYKNMHISGRAENVLNTCRDIHIEDVSVTEIRLGYELQITAE